MGATLKGTVRVTHKDAVQEYTVHVHRDTTRWNSYCSYSTRKDARRRYSTHGKLPTQQAYPTNLKGKNKHKKQAYHNRRKV